MRISREFVAHRSGARKLGSGRVAHRSAVLSRSGTAANAAAPVPGGAGPGGAAPRCRARRRSATARAGQPRPRPCPGPPAGGTPPEATGRSSWACAPAAAAFSAGRAAIGFPSPDLQVASSDSQYGMPGDAPAARSWRCRGGPRGAGPCARDEPGQDRRPVPVVGEPVLVAQPTPPHRWAATPSWSRRNWSRTSRRRTARPRGGTGSSMSLPGCPQSRLTASASASPPSCQSACAAQARAWTSTRVPTSCRRSLADRAACVRSRAASAGRARLGAARRPRSAPAPHPVRAGRGPRPAGDAVRSPTFAPDEPQRRHRDQAGEQRFARPTELGQREGPARARRTVR